MAALNRLVNKHIDSYPLSKLYQLLITPLVFVLLALVCFPETIQAQDRYVYTNAPLKEVIEDIEKDGIYRFLYRDALVSGKEISLDTSTDQLVNDLEEALRPQRVQVLYDATHGQIMLANAREKLNAQNVILSGHILDEDTGARLPFANVTWIQDGYLQGVTTNEAGYFHAQFDNIAADSPDVTLSVTYVGYHSEQVTIDFAHLPSELSIRLQPATIQGHEVLISSNVLNTNLDTTWHHLLNHALFSPFGESSVIRSLNALPAVALSTALSDGLNVRGSKADGFQVLLDGAPIYNQNHFFGMFDAFNSDALQTVGFYYDIAPASFFAPPGGTLSFLTRSGSFTRFKGSLAASSTSIRGTFEGPIVKGKSSWLISGRHSYLDRVNWFNNQDIVGIGLDINRSSSELPGSLASVEELQVNPVSSNARFYDVHGKLTSESSKGVRTTLSFYVGGNNTDFLADRVTIVRNENTNRLGVTEEPARTLNKWGNEAISLQFHHRLGSRAFLRSTLAGSHYLSSFEKDDFVYTRLNRNDRPRNYIFPFSHRNELIDIKWAEHLDIATAGNGLWSFGGAINYFGLVYEEQSANRPEFSEDYYALQSDLYSEYERKGNLLDMRIGLRGVYFSQGAVLRLSPRTQFTLFPKGRVSLRAGYSKNYQFLHQLYLENTNTASIWVMTTGAQGPSSVHNVTAGIYVKVSPHTLFQLEGYYRDYEKLRRHEINAPTSVSTFNALRFVPWFSENNAYAKGIEVLFKQQMGKVLWTNSYTLSKVELQNDESLEGNRFPAEWDRRHQYTTNVQFEFSPRFSAHLSWFYATGNPDGFTYSATAPPERLPDYHRMDASITIEQPLRTSLLQFTLSAYNLYNAENTWYRDQVHVFNPSRPSLGTGFVNVDVFDLGFQPSFDVSLSF